METEKLTLTVDEAAKLVGISKNTMLKFVKMDKFPAMQLQRKILINKKQFIEWFNNLTLDNINLP